MKSKQLSNSFSAHELKNISSYREQRMRSKPRASGLDAVYPLSASRKDLYHIQYCLKSNFSRRRSSQGSLSNLLSRPEGLESTIGKLNREVYQLDSPIISDYLAAEIELGKTRHFAHRYDTYLNVIEYKPAMEVCSQPTYSRKKEALLGLKARIHLNTASSKQIGLHSSGVNRAKLNESILQDLTPKQTPTSRITNLRKPSKICQNNTKTNRIESIRFSKRLYMMKYEFAKVPFRRQEEMQGYFDRIIEFLKDE